MTIPTPPTNTSYLDDGVTTYTAALSYGQVGGTAKVFDTGSGVVVWAGVCIFNILASNLATGDEIYLLTVQGSNDPTFATGVFDLASGNGGAPSQVPISLNNQSGGVIYRYLRLKIQSTGTSPSIQVLAFVVPMIALSSYTLDQLTALQATISGNWTNAVTEYRNWFTGTPTGTTNGGDGTGRYPLTDGNGVTTMMLCPAANAAAISAITGLTQAVIDALVEWTDTTDDANPVIPVTVQPPGGGSRVLKKININTFAERPLADLEVYDPNTDFSDAINTIACVSSSGKSYQAAVSYITRSFGNVIDPTRAPYNVVYDYQKIKNVFTTVGSNLVNCDTAIFTSADIGKLAAVSNGTTGGALVGYIGQVVDSKNIKLFTDTTYATPMNSNQATTYGEMVWGTDNTTGLQAAINAAEPRNASYGPGGVVALGGWALTTALQFGSIAIVGLGKTQCGLVQLPGGAADAALLSDKTTGTYATLRPQKYILQGFGLNGQIYTQYYSSFRNCLNITGGQFANFIQGAPYAVIQDLEVTNAQVDGIVTYGAFAGQMSGISVYQCTQIGMRNGFWDLNGTDWHLEGNGCTGLFSAMTGANVANIRASYNGKAYNAVWAGQYWPDELGANMAEVGYGNTYTTIRCQESGTHNLCISNVDYLGSLSGQGGNNRFYMSTLDDTGDIVPVAGGYTAQYPSVRAMVYVNGNTSVNNRISLMTGAGQVHPTNYATHAYFDNGNPSGNIFDLQTPGIANTSAAYYDGGTAAGGATIPGGTGAYAPGPSGTTSGSSIGSRNTITINGVAQ